jgi:hypothetical protein
MNRLFELAKKILSHWLSTTALGVMLLLSGMSVAQLLEQPKFASPDDACQALFSAVQSGNEPAITKVLGGGEDLVSSEDAVQDRHDRALFLEKYEQRHRVVQDDDGSATLYIGAENWPFPVPLVSKNGRWYFERDSGA